MKMRHLLLPAIYGVLMLNTWAGAATILSDGSFENSSNASGGHYLNGTSGWQAVNFTGYTSGVRVYDHTSNTWITTDDGSRIVALNQGGTGGVQQVFDTTPGQTYTLTFAYSSIGDSTARTDVATRYEVDSGILAATSASGTVLNSGTASVDTPAHNLLVAPWTTYTLTFTATDTTSTVRFLSVQTTGGSAFGPVIDNVQVTAVPEPATMGLLAIGGLALLRRR